MGNIDAIVLKVSNVPAEGLYSLIKMIKVSSRGFRNKARFANAIYFHLGALDHYPQGWLGECCPLDQGNGLLFEPGSQPESSLSHEFRVRDGHQGHGFGKRLQPPPKKSPLQRIRFPVVNQVYLLA